MQIDLLAKKVLMFARKRAKHCLQYGITYSLRDHQFAMCCDDLNVGSQLDVAMVLLVYECVVSVAEWVAMLKAASTGL